MQNDIYEKDYEKLKGELKSKYREKVINVLKLSREKLKLTLHDMVGDELSPIIESFGSLYVRLGKIKERFIKIAQSCYDGGEESFKNFAEEGEPTEAQITEITEKLKIADPDAYNEYLAILEDFKVQDEKFSKIIKDYAVPIAEDENSIKNDAKAEVLKLVAQYNVELKDLKNAFGLPLDKLEVPFDGDEAATTEDGKIILKVDLQKAESDDDRGATANDKNVSDSYAGFDVIFSPNDNEEKN